MKFHRNKIIQFCISTLYEFSFKTRVVLNNKFNEPSYVNCILRNQHGDILLELPYLREIYDYCAIETDPWLSPLEYKDFILDFSIVPLKYGEEKFIDASYDEIKKMYGLQDHFVEYYNDDSSFGVLYNIPPNLNNKNFGARFSTLFQGPKLKVGERYKTYILFLNSSSDIEYETSVSFKSKIYSSNGNLLAEFEDIVPANGRRLIDIASIFNENNVKPDSEEFYVETISNEGTIIPLTITKNGENFSMEHSIPPIGYGNKIFGDRKMEILAKNLENF